MKRTGLKLRTRIGLYFLGLGVTWTVFVVLLLGDLLSDTSRQLLRERGAHLARLLALECAPLVHYEDVSSISKVLSEHVSPPSDVRYIVVLNGTGEVIWSTFHTGVPSALLNVPHTIEAGPGVLVQLVRMRDELLYDYEATKAGVRVRMGMSLVPVQLFAQRLTTHILWIGGAALLAVFALALHVSRPVEALVSAVVRSAKVESPFGGAAALRATLETSALADSFEDVLNRLEERTRQLDRSQKLAYLGEISASVAHEINNPLGVIVLNSGFLARRAAAGELGPAATTEVERLRSAATRATLAAQRMLQFARYSTQRTGIKRRPFQPEALIRETVDLLRDRIKLAGCTVEVEVPKDLPHVSLDQQGIQQVLFNLLTNALEASPEGGPITIRTEIAGGAFLLTVADRGTGMTDEMLRHAREPFVTSKQESGGTGLGLAVSDSIVQAHGGVLALERRPGGGTTATVRVPIEVST